MARIAFLLLTHKRPDRVLEQARILTSRGDYVAIHLDRRAPLKVMDQLREGLADNDRVVFADRVACGWGEWSLVQATLNMVRAAASRFGDATHFFLMSGDCMPIKPAGYIHQALDADDRDQIEHADFFEDGWIKTGMVEDRLIYRHWFNERSQSRLFYGALAIQRALGLKRSVPRGLRMRIGSQWWVLRRGTIEKLLAFLDQRPDVVRFFRTTWIPDETFFQTLVMHLVAKEEVVSAPPTFLMFTDYGLPVTFHADHLPLLKSQRHMFARKISDNDDALRSALGAYFASDEPVGAVEASGQSLYDYLRQRGRLGRRFAPRAWEAGAQLGAERTLIAIVCKKWHIGNRLAGAVAEVSDLPALGYVFEDQGALLPDLGGIEKTTDKRNRHRRAVLNLLYRHYRTDRLAICIDPSNTDAITDFASDGCQLHVLEIDCAFDADWLSGHAERIGLGTQAGGSLSDGLMKTLTQNIADERLAMRELGLSRHWVVPEGAAPGSMARDLASCFGLNIDTAARVARRDGLFD